MKPDHRMRLESLGMVNRIAEARAKLLTRIQALEAPYESVPLGCVPTYCITIDAERLGEDILALVRPVIVAEYRAQIMQLDRDLAALGVDADKNGT